MLLPARQLVSGSRTRPRANGKSQRKSSGRESSRESVHGRSATTVRAIAEGARWLDLACNQEELFHAVTANRPRFAVLAGA